MMPRGPTGADRRDTSPAGLLRRLESGRRINQLLIDQHNCVMRTARREAFRRDWHRRHMAHCADQNALRALVYDHTGSPATGPAGADDDRRASVVLPSDDLLLARPVFRLPKEFAGDPPPDPPEVFSGYSEQSDPNSRVTEENGAKRLDVDGLQMNEDCWYLDDKGAGHFANFDHDMEVTLVSVSADNGGGGFWLVTNTIDDLAGMWGNNDDCVFAFAARRAGPIYRLELYETKGNDSAALSSNIATGTKYYCSIIRSGSTVTLYAYTDSDRNNLYGSASVTINAATTYRYVGPLSSWNGGTTQVASLDTENLDLQEFTPYPYPLRTMTGGIRE